MPTLFEFWRVKFVNTLSTASRMHLGSGTLAYCALSSMRAFILILGTFVSKRCITILICVCPEDGKGSNFDFI